MTPIIKKKKRKLSELIKKLQRSYLESKAVPENFCQGDTQNIIPRTNNKNLDRKQFRLPKETTEGKNIESNLHVGQTNKHNTNVFFSYLKAMRNKKLQQKLHGKSKMEQFFFFYYLLKLRLKIRLRRPEKKEKD